MLRETDNVLRRLPSWNELFSIRFVNARHNALIMGSVQVVKNFMAAFPKEIPMTDQPHHRPLPKPSAIGKVKA